MNESRRKEIEEIIERLEAEESRLRQIRIADRLAGDDVSVFFDGAWQSVDTAIRRLRREIG